MEFTRLTPAHDDVVHDIAFDFYGKRFATCSSDKIRIWDCQEDGPGAASASAAAAPGPSSSAAASDWTCVDIPRAPHQNSVWRLSWAHPEFGQVFASCSEDRMVVVWEEWSDVSYSSAAPPAPGGAAPGPAASKQRWQSKASLTEAKRAVNDVKFAPRHLGLKLASCSADGYLRVYEATDVFSLNYWQMQDAVQVEETSDKAAAIAAAAAAGGAVGGVGGAAQPEGRPLALATSEHGLTCLSWNDSPFDAEMIAVGGHSRRLVVLSRVAGKWAEAWSHTGPGVVHDVAWAPAMGRSSHQIATASREGFCQIHQLKRAQAGAKAVASTPPTAPAAAASSAAATSAPTTTSSASPSSSSLPPAAPASAPPSAAAEDAAPTPGLVPMGEPIDIKTASPVWRVAWNATGTVLATSSEDGTLSLWRKNFQGVWCNVQTVAAGPGRMVY